MKRTSLWLCILTAIVSGCTGDAAERDTSSVTSNIAGCTGTGFSLFDQVCGVGQANGKPAVSFRGQWFGVDYNGGSWLVTNAVAGQESAVAPADSVLDSRQECAQNCPPDCPGHGMECQVGVYEECVASCNAYYTLEEHRRFTWTVAGSSYIIEGTQTVEDQQVIGGQQDLRIASGLLFTLGVADPVDGNPWTVVIHPVRAKNGASNQGDVNTQVRDPGATTTTDVSGALFSPAQVNVSTTSSVELMSAVKTSAPGTSEMVARGNPAMNRALDTVLPQGSSFQSHTEPQALQTTGSVLTRLASLGGSTGTYDLQRFSQFFLDDRRGHAGFSSQGTGERPLALSSPKEWHFRHTILNYELNFPFLAGICGFNVFVNSYIAGALNFGRTACFDGLAMNVDLGGNLEFALKAGGGLGCNIFVASASAGLGAGIKAAAEFATALHTDTLPPSVTSSVNIYSEVSYAAHFKVRVLFWSKKWEKILGAHRIFQKSASFNLAAQVPDPAVQLCTDDGSTQGTCPAPATCDVTGQCVRYDFAGDNSGATRVETGACLYAPRRSVSMDYEGSCDFLRACSAPSRNETAPYVVWACPKANTEDSPAGGKHGTCSDADLWVAAPQGGLCGRNVRICRGTTCVTALVKDRSNADVWEGSIGVFDGLGLNHSEDTATCSGIGRARVTVDVVPLPRAAKKPKKAKLVADDGLYPDQLITSDDGRFRLVLQGSDGNLVLYQGATPLWATYTFGGAVATQQADGNFVVYDVNEQPLWASNTNQPGSQMVLQNDGNLVLYNAAGTPLWASNTCCH